MKPDGENAEREIRGQEAIAGTAAPLSKTYESDETTVNRIDSKSMYRTAKP